MLLLIRYAIAITLLAPFCTVANADHGSRKRLVDRHAPTGVMGDHLHEVGQWMVEYRYMNMYMEDNRIGETTVDDATALGTTVPVGPPGPGIAVDGITTNLGATPTNMTMEMHMALTRHLPLMSSSCSCLSSLENSSWWRPFFNRSY